MCIEIATFERGVDAFLGHYSMHIICADVCTCVCLYMCNLDLNNYLL